MRIAIEPQVHLYVDIEGCGLVPDGPSMREKPTLLLMHGGPGFDHSSFKPLFSRLADVAQVVYYDHRGHGRSDRRPASEWTLDHFADDIVRLCDALGIVRPIVLGQSFGGFVAQRYLARHPGHAAKVVLSSTAPNMDLDRKLAMFERLGGGVARDAAAAFWTAPGPQTWIAYERYCRPLYNRVRPQGDDASRRALFSPEILYAWAAGEQRSMNLRPGLAAVQCPVLVLAGELDPVTPIDDARDIAAAIPAPWGRLATFAHAGHGVWRDEPEAAMSILREFICGEITHESEIGRGVAIR
ncbi:MAG: alpha/beta hydrolase [Burkholderiales bacterium]|nr:alpha/beta hydrolase [Burkholderiales bacterium]MDE1926623.1 alpha/beta hydrolase [Burkholderiales bacterium]MDE2160346.1 alpha/beta hydrolase [Burkholderiales bacterium]MDE2502430.1 alpha/beta hydrolase [Burkholderiales bacterium]